MAELNDYQKEWLQKSGGKPIDVAKVQERLDARSKRLDDLINNDLAANKSEIERAQNFSLTKEDEKRSLWNKLLGNAQTLKWKADDDDLNPLTYDVRADKEVDSRADIVGVKEPSEEDRRAVQLALDRLLAIQTEMLNEFDDEGNRVFTDDDIRRELWQPLVRDNTIPENLVPKRFSDQAQAFQGAAEMYQERIDKYSKSSTGHEDQLRRLKIGGKTVGLVGTLATNSITIGSATDLASMNEQLRTGKAPNGDTLSEAQKTQLKVDKDVLEQKNAWANFAATSMTGGFQIVEAGIKEGVKDDPNWAAFADTTFKAFASIAAAGCSTIAKEIIGPGTNALSDEGKVKLKVAATVQGSILGGISAIRMVPTLLTAIREKKKGTQIVETMIQQLGDVVSQAFVAAAAHETNKDQAAGLIQLGAAIKTSLISLSSAPDAIRLASEGKTKEAALKLGAGVILSSGSLVSMFTTEYIKQNVTSTDLKDASFAQSNYMEQSSTIAKDGTVDAVKSKENATKVETDEAKLTLKVQEELAKQLKIAEQKVLADFKVSDQVTVDPEARNAAEAMAKQVSEAQQKMADEELTKHFGDRKNVDDIFKDVEAKLGPYEEMYAKAMPDAEIDGKPPTEVEEALMAIDRAMALTAQLRAKAEMINGLTAAGAAVLAAAVPGTGAVVAAQKVANDIFLVVRAVQMHNKWVESMEISFRAYSGYATGIQKTLENARITLSRESVKLVLDTFKLGAEIGRCFDPTGGATIASASLTMTSALVEFGYEMAKEREIDAGWAAYKRAREDPANRKAARKALRLNSTLAKCCIAYGAVMAKDPAAQEAIRIAGLSPAQLADSKDVCRKLISFLEAELSDDPVVMHVERQPKPWQPGKPELTPGSWFETKAAATRIAEPRMSPASAKTPAIDAALAKLAGKDLWNGKSSYAAWREAFAKDKDQDALRKSCALATTEVLNDLVSQFLGYQPVQADSSEKHSGMADVAATMRALCQVNLKACKDDTV